MDLPEKSMTFIVRISVDSTEHVTGVVERVSTGQKCRFHSIAEICVLIETMAGEEKGLDASTNKRS